MFVIFFLAVWTVMPNIWLMNIGFCVQTGKINLETPNSNAEYLK